ncbi:MAG: hypothetical protein ACKVTZ_08655 [Bacteroidia bacterium]
MKLFSGFILPQTFLLCMSFLMLSTTVVAQNAPRFKKYPIEKTSCAVYFPSEPTQIQHSTSNDSSDLYICSATWNEQEFGFILVQFSEEIKEESSIQKDVLNKLTMSYLDFLKEQLEIKNSAGYGLGHIHPENESAIGIIDYWEDAEGKEYEVKTWTDAQFMAVMFIIHTPENELNYNIREMYFHGFRFPEK